MKYNRFEDLPVWKDSAQLAARIFRWTAQPLFKGKGDLANQIQRATLSISNNIAEGFERGTTPELLTFLYYARGSAGEVRSILCVMDLMPEFTDLKSQISDFRKTAESIARQIRGWADSLQNSDIKGQPYLTQKSKTIYGQKKKVSAFLRELDEINQRAAEKRKQERQSKLSDDLES